MCHGVPVAVDWKRVPTDWPEVRLGYRSHPGQSVEMAWRFRGAGIADAGTADGRYANPATMVPAEKINTMPMITEANQPQFKRPIMHIKPVPITASVATAIPMGPVRAASTDSSMF